MKFLSLVILLFSLSSYAATTGTLNLQGSVLAQFSLVVNANMSTSTSLDILGGETKTQVAQVVESSNNAGGYKIMMSSANGGLLKNGTASPVTYTISYNAAPAIQPTIANTTVRTSGVLTQLTTYTSSVKISFPAKPDALGGTYTDTLTFTIAAP